MALQPRKSMDMTTGTLADKILLFALPLMASSMLQLLFNAVDVVVVGRYVGKEALAAVGSNNALINLVVAIFIGLSVGTNVVIARDFGAKRYDAVNSSVHNSVLLALIGGIILAIFGFFSARQLLVWMSSPEDVIDLGTQYLRIYFLGMPAQLLYNFGAAILRAKGDTRRPLVYLTIAGITNVILNLFFVIILHLSVTGVALATIISQYISATLVIRTLTQEEETLRLDFKKLRIDWFTVQKILAIGLPAGCQSAIFSLSNVVVQSTVNSFDSSVMSGVAAAASIEAFVYTGMNAFHQTSLTFIGQNFGAADTKRIDRTMQLCLLYVFLTGAIMGTFTYCNGPALIGLYAPGEEDVIAAGMIRMYYIGRLYFICGIMDVLTGILRGLGKSLVPMIISMIGACGLRLAWVQWVFPLDPTPTTLYLSYPITWGVTIFFLTTMLLTLRPSIYRKLREERLAS